MQSIERTLRWFDRAHRQVPVAIATVVVLAALLIATSWSTLNASANLRAQQAWQVHTLSVLLAADRAEIAALQIIRGERGYVLTGKEEFLQPFSEGDRDLSAAVDEIATLTRDNPSQVRRVAGLRSQARDLQSVTANVVAKRRAGDEAGALAVIRSGEGRIALTNLTRTLDEASAEERRLLATRTRQTDAAAEFQESAVVTLSLVGLFMICFATLAVFVLRQAFAREGEYRAELRRRAGTDELTGIANRREALAGLDRAVAAARRDGRPLAFATLDIDHFKSVNDTHGHPAGDEVIRQVAQAAVDTVRGCDLVGRLGGEEFAIVLPGANIHEAQAVCERLRVTVQKLAIAVPGGKSVSVSISTGVAKFMPGETAEAMISRADDALYQAKRGGRDQVRLAA